MRDTAYTPSERAWREVRGRLDAGRHELGAIAAGRYPDLPRAAGTTLLTRPEWLPPAPVPLGSLRLAWRDPAAPEVSGAAAGPELTAGRPAYSAALADLAPPAALEDRPCYRLLAADLVRDRTLLMSSASYFDALDVGEAAAHELAAGGPSPFRSLAGDPRDLGRRPAVPAVTTLTVRRGPRPAYVLHRRDAAKVAHAGGLYQVMPVGVLQPAGGPARPGPELDLWRGMVREYAEEFLGRPEEYGPGFSYGDWPFAGEMTRAREAGGLGVHCLGLGVDPLTLAVDLLAVAVFDAPVFDGLFGGLVDVNAEGEVALVPFADAPPGPMQPAGLATLRLAARHRRDLGF